MFVQTGFVLGVYGFVSLLTGLTWPLFLSVFPYFIWLAINLFYDFPFQRLHGIRYVEQMIYEGDEWYKAGETEKALNRYRACDLMLDAYDPNFKGKLK